MRFLRPKFSLRFPNNISTKNHSTILVCLKLWGKPIPRNDSHYILLPISDSLLCSFPVPFLWASILTSTHFCCHFLQASSCFSIQNRDLLLQLFSSLLFEHSATFRQLNLQIATLSFNPENLIISAF